MAKSDTDTRAPKLPKRVAGVKLSKRTRERGGQIVALMKHPIVAPLALATVAAGFAAMKDARVRAAADRARTKAGEAASNLSHGAAVVGSAIAAKASEGKRRVGDAYRHASEAYDAAHTNGTGNGSKRTTATRRSPAKGPVKETAPTH